jgi:imidazolonepropionase-like amidohydrolase
MPPPGSRGAGASRVHNTTEFGVGYPEATPSVKGLDAKTGFAAARRIRGADTPAAVKASEAERKSRREVIWRAIEVVLPPIVRDLRDRLNHCQTIARAPRDPH